MVTESEWFRFTLRGIEERHGGAERQDRRERAPLARGAEAIGGDVAADARAHKPAKEPAEGGEFASDRAWRLSELHETREVGTDREGVNGLWAKFVVSCGDEGDEIAEVGVDGAQRVRGHGANRAKPQEIAVFDGGVGGHGRRKLTAVAEGVRKGGRWGGGVVACADTTGGSDGD